MAETEAGTNSPAIALTIAGFDPSSGAGVTADLQVFAAHGFFGTAAITAMTVQSTRGVADMQAVDPVLLRAMLRELQSDLPPVGIKIGMLGSGGCVQEVAEFLLSFKKPPVVVLDPVLRSSSGSQLLEHEALGALSAELLPLVDWMTPNWEELATLSGEPVGDEAAAVHALKALGERHTRLGIVATGGDQVEPVDLLRHPGGGRVDRLSGEHVETTSTHGTGCAFSSALLCGLVRDSNPVYAAKAAKRYVEGALRRAPKVGGGRGPLNLLWPTRAAAKAVVV